MSSQLLFVALAGFTATMIDGVLGMGFGPTSSTILLSAGLSPKAVSTTVNLAKVATGVAGGAAHWKIGNVDKKLVLRLAIPGVVGALIGVTVLANVDGDALKPYLAFLLLAIGLRILIRFSKPMRKRATDTPHVDGEGYSTRGIAPAGLAGGVTNGLIGAWGPVVTPVLLNRDGIEPRISIGSVNIAEIAVASAAAGSLVASLGKGTIDVGILLAMLIGVVIAATFDLGASRWIAYVLVVMGVAAAALRPRWQARTAAVRDPAIASS